jgi:hypothetical protein
MKYSAVLCLLVLFTCQCNSKETVMAKLLNEQKFLKDSANNINDRIGNCARKGVNDSAETQRKRLGAVHARLIDIQSAIDSLEKMQ